MKYEHRYLFVEILEGVLLVMLGVLVVDADENGEVVLK